MSQAKIVISEIFENVQYEIYPNGGSAQVMAETPDHKVGTSYSPLDLFPDSPSARIGMQNELNNLLSYIKPNGFYNDLIHDAQYSLKGFQSTLEKLKLLSIYNSKNVKIVYLHFTEGDIFGKTETVGDVYISNLKHADTLGRYYSKLTGKKYVGYITIKRDLKHLKAGHRHLKAKNLRILSDQVENKKLFDLPDTIKTPFEKMHLWAWLTTNKYDGSQNTVEILRKYLRSLGFNRGLHKLGKENIQSLRTALSFYYDVNFKYKDHPLKAVK